MARKMTARKKQQWEKWCVIISKIMTSASRMEQMWTLSWGTWCQFFWKVFLMRNWMRNLVIPNMITGIKIRITAATGIPKRQCIPATGTWIWQFQETVMASTSHSWLRNTRIPLHRTRKKRCSWNVCRWKWECQVLAFHYERSQEQGCRGHPNCLYWWTYRFPPGNRSCLSTDRNPAVHHSSDSQFHKVCIL